MAGLAASKTRALPDGFDDEVAFLADAREKFQLGLDADRENRDMGMEDLRFLSGDQWDAEAKKQRQDKGRPCLTINNLPQFVGQVIGDTRANRPAIKVRPAEDSDKKTADIRQGLVRFIENTSNANQVYALAGEDQVSCGVGNFQVKLVYATDDTFDQDIKIEHIPNPFAVVWDASSVEPTGKDADHCFVVDEVARKVFEKAYPDALPSELTIPLEQSGWYNRDTVRVTQYWSMKETKRRIALVLRPPAAEPSIEDVTDNEAEVTPLIVKDGRGAPRVRDKIKRSACMYIITGQAILEGPFEYPIKRVPVIKVTGREIRVGDRRYRFGLIRFAKDAARMKNLWRSSAAEWISLAPKQQWLLHASNKDEAKRYREAGRSGDTVLTYEGNIPPTRIDPPSGPAALLQEAALNDQDIKDVTGLHDASLGMKSNETSGKAILARERQGDTATFMYHDNLASAVQQGGDVINDLIPITFDAARTITTLGEDGSSAAHRINDPAAEGGLINFKTGKYDVVVEVGPSYSTKRVEAAQSMMEFVRDVPGAGEVAGDLIAKAQDWPMADEIAERLKRRLPPGLADEDDADLTEEQKAAKAQQKAAADAEQAEAKAMAKRAAELELDQKQATVLKTDAEAHKIEAETRQAAKPAPGEPEKPLDDALKVNQVRKAEADAEKAEFESQAAFLAVKKAQLEVIALGGDPTLPIETLGPDEARAAAAPAAPPGQPPKEPPPVAAADEPAE